MPCATLTERKDTMSLDQFKMLTFDVVGTLIDFETGLLDSIRSISGKTPAELTDDQIFGAYLRGRQSNPQRSSEVMEPVYVALAKELGLPSDERTAQLFQLSVLRQPAFKDSIEALRRLRRKFRLVAMTNADRTAFSAYSNTLGDPFDDSVTFDEAECAKPDPMFFAYTRGRQSAFGYKKEETLHVAQSQYHDIGVARSLGYKVCWIERRHGIKGFGGTPAVSSLTRPDFHFSSLKALADAVDAS
jgi:putative hydrolase of the HAD superfamily